MAQNAPLRTFGGANVEAVSGSAQFKLRTPHAMPHSPGSESSGEIQGAPRSSAELRRAWVCSTCSVYSV
eukprot:15434966-Alexandrium_andersonii.AAC.1